MAKVNRFRVAMCAFVVLGVLEWITLAPETVRVINGPTGVPLLEISVRGIAIAVLVLFACRSWVCYQREMLEERERSGRE